MLGSGLESIGMGQYANSAVLNRPELGGSWDFLSTVVSA